MDWEKAIPWIIALAALFFNVFQYLRRKKNKAANVIVDHETRKKIEIKEQEITDTDKRSRYCQALRSKLGNLDLLGSPDIKSQIVKLEDAFVSLSISESWRCEERFLSSLDGPNDPQRSTEIIANGPKSPNKKFLPGGPGGAVFIKRAPHGNEPERYLSPEQVMKRAFRDCRLLVIIGDPGSGKTTLLKYYVVGCLDIEKRKYRDFGFSDAVLPLYFPLRELEFDDNNEPTLLPDNLARWAGRFLLGITAEQFLRWLEGEQTLVLLDGLDEISSKERRKNVCRWVEAMCSGLNRARFVVTSRSTGYRKLDGIEMGVRHLRADIMDFSRQQQELFLKKWFRAVYLSVLPAVGEEIPELEWQQKQEGIAEQKSEEIISFLNREDNLAVRELAAVPMLLQIMAIIWKDHQFLPASRSELYDAALNYLLDYRDRYRKMEPILRVEKARRVLTPVGLWMQEKLKKDEISKIKMHKFLKPLLEKLSERPGAVEFCENLRDRAGLIVDYDENHYIFRHKSFREFLAGLQLVKEAGYPDRMEAIVAFFDDDWWEETFRFFMSKADDEVFDRFMQALFRSPVSQRLDDNKQTLLRNLVLDAPLKKVDALASSLNSDELNENQRRYVMDCLRTIATLEAMEAIESADKSKMTEAGRSYAEEIIAESRIKAVPQEEFAAPEELKTLDSFRNSIEGGVEYIKIPGGTYKYSLTEKMVTVPDLYFCKYLVTNQRYRRFIAYLQRKEPEFEKMLSLDRFAQQLLKFARSIEERYSEYLGNQPEKWPDEFPSYFDDEKRFKGSDQPVIGVSWYAARAYCFWLSCLETVLQEKNGLDDIDRLSQIYRLPIEEEWEWAAGGNPDGSVRKYPWSGEKGEPNPNLANYDKNVNATTPVGRYPEGATPHGLMDMAGNAWEYMENLYKKDENWRALRGGSWFNSGSSLLCSARLDDFVPVSGGYLGGYRVCRAQSL